MKLLIENGNSGTARLDNVRRIEWEAKEEAKEQEAEKTSDELKSNAGNCLRLVSM